MLWLSGCSFWIVTRWAPLKIPVGRCDSFNNPLCPRWAGKQIFERRFEALVLANWCTPSGWVMIIIQTGCVSSTNGQGPRWDRQSPGEIWVKCQETACFWLPISCGGETTACHDLTLPNLASGSYWPQLLSSCDSHLETLFWHSFWHTIWKCIWHIYSDILSDILSGILFGISSEILCGWGPAGNTLIQSSLFGSRGEHCDLALAVEVRRRWRRRRRDKSNNPHLTGKKHQLLGVATSRSPWDHIFKQLLAPKSTRKTKQNLREEAVKSSQAHELKLSSRYRASRMATGSHDFHRRLSIK